MAKADCKPKVKDLELAMVAADLTGEGLREAAGLGKSTVSNARQGRPVSRSAAMAISAALGKPFKTLFTEIGA